MLVADLAEHGAFASRNRLRSADADPGVPEGLRVGDQRPAARARRPGRCPAGTVSPPALAPLGYGRPSSQLRRGLGGLSQLPALPAQMRLLRSPSAFDTPRWPGSG